MKIDLTVHTNEALIVLNQFINEIAALKQSYTEKCREAEYSGKLVTKFQGFMTAMNVELKDSELEANKLETKLFETQKQLDATTVRNEEIEEENAVLLADNLEFRLTIGKAWITRTELEDKIKHLEETYQSIKNNLWHTSNTACGQVNGLSAANDVLRIRNDALEGIILRDRTISDKLDADNELLRLKIKQLESANTSDDKTKRLEAAYQGLIKVNAYQLDRISHLAGKVLEAENQVENLKACNESLRLRVEQLEAENKILKAPQYKPWSNPK